METESLIEEWRDVVGFEGLYQVSNLGRVKGLDRLVDTNINNVNRRIHKGKLLKPRFHNKGYKRANLCKNGNINRAFVHRLVAEAYNDTGVRHIGCVCNGSRNSAGGYIWKWTK